MKPPRSGSGWLAISALAVVSLYGCATNKQCQEARSRYPMVDDNTSEWIAYSQVVEKWGHPNRQFGSGIMTSIFDVGGGDD